MSTWQYRLVREPTPGGDRLRMIEAYYEEGTPFKWPGTGSITGWAWASAPEGEKREEIVAEVEHMLEAVKAPILPADLLPGYEREEP